MPSVADAPEPPAPPSRPPDESKLWRSDDDRYLAGVAGGVGERLALDPFFVRVGLVIATLLLAGADAPPLAAFAYVVAWLGVPEAGRESLFARVAGDADARREAAVAVLLLGATAVLVPRLGPGGSPGLRLGVALFGLAVLLLATRPRALDASDALEVPTAAPTSPPPPDPAIPPPPSAQAPPPPPRAASRAGVSLRGAWPAGRRRRPRREPALWPLTVSALVLYAVVCAIADQVLDPGLDPGLAVSGALLVVGAVLAVSAWRGRAGSTLMLGVALLPLWAGLTATDIDRYPGIGGRTHRPTSASDAETGFELGYGGTVVDLRAVPLRPGQELRTAVGLTAGIARIRVPADAELVVTGDIGLGSISVNRYSRWDVRSESVVDRTLDRRYGPVPTTCSLQPVSTQGLSFTNAQFSTVDALDDELERRGWPASRPTDSPSPEDAGEWVLVGVDEQWQLCDASAPAVPEDPATIVLDVHLGIGRLEITREHQA